MDQIVLVITMRSFGSLGDTLAKVGKNKDNMLALSILAVPSWLCYAVSPDSLDLAPL